MEKRFNFDMKEIIVLLGKNLYTSSEIVIRELVQNSYDSILLKYKNNSKEEGRIQINISSVSSTLEIIDNGTGMTKEGLEKYLSNLGQGLKKIKNQINGKNQIIGEYGIGFFSAFMIAERITVITKAENSNPQIWESIGNEKYDVDDIEDNSIKVGTKIVIKLQRNSKSYSDPYEIDRIVKKYCNFIRCPIYINDLKKPKNKISFPWEVRSKKSQEKIIRNEILKDLLHFKVGHFDQDSISFHYLLGVSDSYDSNQSIYCKRMFVTSSLNFLPNYLQFIDFIFNCDEISLNLSRDSVIQNNLTIQLFDKAEELSLNWLNNLINLYPNDEKLIDNLNEYQSKFRNLSLDSSKIFNKLYQFITFRCINHETKLNINQYISKFKNYSNLVYYTRRDKKGNNIIEKSERLLLLICENQNIPVIIVEDNGDDELLRKICNKVGAKKSNINENIPTFLGNQAKGTKDINKVANNFKRLLGKSCKISDFQPSSLPLIFDEETIILNATNPFLNTYLSNLSGHYERIRPIYTNIYRFFSEIDRLKIDKNQLIDVIKTFLNSLKNWGEVVEQFTIIENENEYITNRWWNKSVSIHTLNFKPRPFHFNGKKYMLKCFIVMPFKPPYKDVENTIVEVCSNFSIFAETAVEFDTLDLLEKICVKIDDCDFAIVDISENNPNVMLELGILIARRKPAIIIRDKNISEFINIRVPSDIIGIERIEYENKSEDLKSKLSNICGVIEKRCL